MTSPIFGKTVTFNTKRAINVVGTVDDGLLIEANKMMKLAENSKRPIDIFINSPGGYVSSGLLFISGMKKVQERGIKIRCFVSELAASMAYTILTQCNERYVLRFAQLLFHAPRAGIRMVGTWAQFQSIAEGLFAAEVKLLKLILPTMGITDPQSEVAAWFVKNYEEERMFIAEELLAEGGVPWFEIVDSMDRLPTPAATSVADHNRASNFTGAIIYMRRGQ